MKLSAQALLVIIFLFAAQAIGQTAHERPTPNAPVAQPSSPDQDVETLKIDTNLVTVPVIASSRTGSYIADLKKEEFKLSEDGTPQQISFLATVNAPFYVVLMLDTSKSTSAASQMP